jgi:deoxycytidylate deaminase
MSMVRAELIKVMNAAYELQQEHLRQCPRRLVTAIITDLTLKPLATGRNLLPKDAQAPCQCNCGVSTLQGASPLCRAVHAEVAALRDLVERGAVGSEAYIFSTSPPCEKCLPQIMWSEIKVLVTTDQYPDRDQSQDHWPGTWIVLPYEDCI